ncbi:MAG TPA: pyridoxal phosphate-dependent aminotransferase [Candidatus Dormibacteraeota bacterium]|nr:pyridoxal phosphate-dependent aminotransferase [Candidatus Dormibacteraeota bacterium]
MRPSERIQAVQSPIIPVVAEWIRQVPDTISLGQGVVSYGPPPEAIAQVQHFLANSDNHKYKPVVGMPELIEAFGRKLKEENGIVLGEEARVVITAGGNMAFWNALLAIADPGDEIILQTPYYFNHEMAVTMANCRPVLVPTDTNYQLQLDAIRDAVTARTRAVVTVSPNNPTGAVYPEAALRAVNELCRERGLFHIHDEAYEYFVYEQARHFSPGSLPGAASHTISLYSLSKAYGFASWRIGAMVIPESLLTPVRKIQDTILICAPVISQYAALGALRVGAAYCRERLKDIARVRTIVRRELTALGGLCEVPPADGAFYFLLRLPGGGEPLALCKRLICEHHVAVIPGNAFGLEQGCHLRIAYAALPEKTVMEGVNRLVNGLSKLV